MDDAQVNDFVDEFEQFVDEPTVRYLFRAQLINFTRQVDSLDLPEGLRIRRMNNEEISAFEQGLMGQFGVPGLHEFCIEAETSVPKVFADTQDPPAEHPNWIASGRS